MSTVVIYKSKYGATQQYAEWISEALGADLYNIRKFDKDQFINYDTVILGGGIYAGNINGISLISKNYEQLKNKKLIIFTVGMRDPSNGNTRMAIQDGFLKVLSPMMQNIKTFSFRGALDSDKINVLHYSMLRIMAQADAEEDHIDTDDVEVFKKALKEPQNYVEYDQIKPLINYVKTMQYLNK